MPDNLDDFVKKGTDPDNLIFFMGAVSQQLKNGNNLMEGFKKDISDLNKTVNKIDNKISLDEQETKIKRKNCGEKFKESEGDIKELNKKVSRDYTTLNDIRERLQVSNGVRREKKAGIHYVVYILTFLVIFGNLIVSAFLLKNNNKNDRNISVNITRDVIREIMKEQKLANGGHSDVRDTD